MSSPGGPSRPVVILLSGGMDSAVTAACAAASGARCYALTFAYGQRHRHEIAAAAAVSRALGLAEHRVYPLDLSLFTASALTGPVEVPKNRPDTAQAADIPVTYVPARNLIFLSIALGWAETLGASEIHCGVNAVDYSGYPDCRPEFIESFARTANLATRAGVNPSAPRATPDAPGQASPTHPPPPTHPLPSHQPAFVVRTPLIGLNKADIVRLGLSYGLDFAITHSCYDPSPEGLACGACDACQIRRRGFIEAGAQDPTRYADRLGDTS